MRYPDQSLLPADTKPLDQWLPHEHITRACTLLEEIELNLTRWGDKPVNTMVTMAQAHAAIAQAKMTAGQR